MTMNPVQIYRDIFLSMQDRQESCDQFVSWMELDADGFVAQIDER
ncbi:hypothetical protein [Acinetobacter baumannii]|nr:hypothetical protein [Acinetobacter baumannii]